jgi:hypothetical protein
VKWATPTTTGESLNQCIKKFIGVNDRFAIISHQANEAVFHLFTILEKVIEPELIRT